MFSIILIFKALKIEELHVSYWQIGGLAASINSPCVRRGCLGECTIRLGYAPFLIAIGFRRVGNA